MLRMIVNFIVGLITLTLLILAAPVLLVVFIHALGEEALNRVRESRL